MSYHNAIWLSDCPEVDLLVVAAGHEHPARLVAQGQAIDLGTVSNELL